MASASITPTIAFFGATGGCANASLVYALKAGYTAVALARKPSKLRDQLLKQKIDEPMLSKQLIIVQGNALNVADVKQTLTAGANGTLVPLIVSGLGGAPVMQFNWRKPLQIFRLDNPTICETATKTLIDALRELYAERPELQSQKPFGTFISSTGVSRGPEDVPFLLRFLYHQTLEVPHIDKKKMEDLYRDNMAQEEPQRVFANIIGVRPTLLYGPVEVPETLQPSTVHAGTEPNPAIGYCIKRSKVGEWIFANVIADEKLRARWAGEMVSLTS